MLLNVEWNAHPYQLNEEQVKLVVPENEGIYRLSNRIESVFYVGQSDNLQRRLLEHLSDEEKNDCIKGKLEFQVYFRFALLKDEKERLCAESFMYRHFKKETGLPCNTKEPSESPCEINLL